MRRTFAIPDIVIQAIFIILIIVLGYPVLVPMTHEDYYNRITVDGLIMMALGYVFLSSAAHTLRSWKRGSVAARLHKFFLFALLLFAGIILGDDFSSTELNYTVIPIILFFALCIYSLNKRSVL